MFGIEGSAAGIYFTAFAKMLSRDFDFPGRKKRPATDPVNALLSLSYTMIFNEMASLLDGLGFDPYLGYFHHPRYGRESLAADLVEEFRAPIGDRLTLSLLNTGIFKKDDFYENPKGGFYLNRDALKRYFAEYEKFLTRDFKCRNTGETLTFRKLFRIQAEKMAAVLQKDEPYTPFLL